MSDREVNIKAKFEAAEASANAKRLHKDIDGIGGAADTSGRRATAALGGVDRAAKGAASSAAQAQQIYENIVRTQGANSAAAQAVAAAMGAQAKSTAGAGQAANTTTGFFGKLNNVLGTTTSQISSQGTIWLGFDAIVQRLAVSLAGPNGLTVGMSLALTAAGFLAARLLGVGEETKRNTQINEQAIAVQAVKLQLMEREAQMMTGATLLSREIGEQRRLLAAVVGGEAVQIAASVKQYEEKKAALMRVREQLDAFTRSGHENSRQADTLRATMKNYTAELVTADEQLKKDVATMRAFQRVTGMGDEALLAFLRSANVAPKILDAVRLALQNVGDEMAAVIQQINSIRMPNISIEGAQGATGALATLGRGRRGLSSLSDIQLTQALSADIKTLIEQSQQQAAILGRTDAERRRIHAQTLADIREHNPEEAKLIDLYARREKGMDAFAESHRRGAGAARAMANELVNLTQKAEQAEAALAGDSFSARQGRLDAEVKAMRAHLVVNNRERRAATDAINRYEVAAAAKLNRDKAESEREFQNELRDMRIRGIEDIYDRERAEMEARLADKAFALVKEFGLTVDTVGKIIAYRQASEEAYARWRLDKERELHRNLDRAAQEYADYRYKLTWKNFGMVNERATDYRSPGRDNQLSTMKEAMRVAEQFERFTGRGATFEENLQLQGSIEALRKLGLEANDVDRIFGSASVSIDQFNARVETLQKYASGDVLGGLKGSFLDLISIQNLAMTTAAAFPIAMQEAFTQAIVYGQNFIEVFGKVLLAGILSAIGQHAIAEGTYHILAGAAKLFNPFTAAAGAKEMAAGAALVAFGSALTATASAITNSLREKQQAAGSAAAGGGAATGGGFERERPTPTTTIDLSRDRQLDSAINSLRRFENSLWRGPVGRIVERLESERAMGQGSGFSANTTVVIQGKEAADLILDVLEDKGVVTVRGLADSPRARNRGPLRHVMKNVVYDIGSRYGKHWV